MWALVTRQPKVLVSQPPPSSTVRRDLTTEKRAPTSGKCGRRRSIPRALVNHQRGLDHDYLTRKYITNYMWTPSSSEKSLGLKVPLRSGGGQGKNALPVVSWFVL